MNLPASRVIYDQAGNRVIRVAGVWLSGFQVNHFIAVAVIGGDDQGPAVFFCRQVNVSNLLVNGFHCLDGGGGDVLCPTMSALAKFTTAKDRSSLAMAFIRVCATSGALISGHLS